MKSKLLYSIILLLFSTNVVMAQQSSEQGEEVQIVQTISVKKGQTQRVHDKSYYEQKIKEINELIQAIEIKISYVKADKEENKIATQNGWYNNMERIKEESRKQKEEYEIIINKIKN